MSSGICIMQTCTAMQLPTSRLGHKTKGIISLKWPKFCRMCSQISYLTSSNSFLFVCMIPIPQADIVLQRELDPINNLRKLRHHGQQCNADEILQKYKEALKVFKLQCIIPT